MHLKQYQVFYIDLVLLINRPGRWVPWSQLWTAPSSACFQPFVRRACRIICAQGCYVEISVDISAVEGMFV